MARLTPQEMADKWANRASGASSEYLAGVERVTTSPGAAAAAKVDKWRAGLQASEAKWRNRVGSVSAEEWKESVRSVGASRYAAGVQAKKTKMERFAAEFLPFLDGVTARTRAMPDTTPEDRINRMIAQVRGVSQFRRGR